MDPSQKAVQEFYPDNMSYCYGCGRMNHEGLQIKSYWDAEKQESVCHFQPKPYHTAIPGYVYGGLIASLVDCHGTGTAAAGVYQAENRSINSFPPLRFVTGSLSVRYLRPTPLGPVLELRGKVREIKGKKVVVDIHVSADDIECAIGEVVAFQVPESMF